MFYMGAAWVVFRPMALELGHRLVEVGSLSTAADIFYLTNDELLLAIELDPEPLLKEAESLEQEVQAVREQAPPEVSSSVPRYIG